MPSAPSARAHGQPAGDGELAVEPGVGEQPAVRLDADQPVAAALDVVARPDLEGRRVGVRADQAHAGVGQRRAADAEGDDAAAVAHDVARVARRERPAVALLEPREAAGLEPARHLRDGVERRGRRVDEGPQVGAGLLSGEAHGERP